MKATNIVGIIVSIVVTAIPPVGTCDQDVLKREAQKAPIIAEVEIVDIGSAVGYWSGVIPALQRVRYKLREVIKGDLKKTEIIGKHDVVQGSKSADVELPRLNPALFRRGNRLIVFLEPNNTRERWGEGLNPPLLDTYLATHEDCGTHRASDEIRRLLRQLILRDSPPVDAPPRSR